MKPEIEHLRAPDFFNTAALPDMTFKSSSFKKINDNKYSVTGNLTFHGITQPVILDATATTNIRSYDNKTIVGFRVKGLIKRTDFGISVDTSAAMVGNEIKIKANVIFVKE